MKTIKDLKINRAGDIHGEGDVIYLEDLQEEAIKQREYKFKMALNAPDRGMKDFLLGQCAFIEEFFDLEEDLK